MFGNSYPHSLKIRGADAIDGEQNPETGRFEPDEGHEESFIYDDKCDAQEMTDKSAGAIVRGDDGDLKEVRGELEVFLEDESKISLLKPAMTGTLTRGSLEDQIVIKAVIQMDATILVDTL